METIPSVDLVEVGIELDRAVQAFVMGGIPPNKVEGFAPIKTSDFLPYSRDLSSAWLVIETLSNEGFDWQAHGRRNSKIAAMRFTREHQNFRGEGKTLAEAICRAAIKAKKNDES